VFAAPADHHHENDHHEEQLHDLEEVVRADDLFKEGDCCEITVSVLSVSCLQVQRTTNTRKSSMISRRCCRLTSKVIADRLLSAC
jgi:hypothetical protein